MCVCCGRLHRQAERWFCLEEVSAGIWAMEYYDPKVRGPAAPQGKASVFNTMAAEAQGKAVFLSLTPSSNNLKHTHTQPHHCS